MYLYIKSQIIMKLVWTTLIVFSIFFSVKAEIFIVNSSDSFNTALSSASSGDSILWQEGVYSDVFLEIDKDDLFIGAQNIGKTVFTGASYAELSGDDMVFKGFQFLDGDIGDENVIDIEGDRILVTEINIRGYTSYKYLRVREASQYVTISYSNFENRLNGDDQNVLSILVDDNQPGYHKVQWCSFKNFPGPGGDYGVEPIRVGVSTQAEFISRSLVEYCYFTNCDGDDELISSKATQNVYRFNTFNGNSKGELVLRHGDQAIVYGNFFLNGRGGVRVREGQQHYIYNNYFDNLSARSIYLQNEDSDPLDDINIAFNVIVNSAEFILGGDGFWDPKNVTIANNIFAYPDDDLFEDPTQNEIWIQNIAFGDLGIAQPAEGLILIDPLMQENSNGIYQITEISPAIDTASDGYKPLLQFEGMDDVDANILFDIMQENRPIETVLKDLGCLEWPHEQTATPWATEENTGPHYDSSNFPSAIHTYDSNELFDLTIYPNPTHDIVYVEVDLKKALDISITLLDVNGKEIRLLSKDEKKVGVYKVQDSLKDLQSGTYFLKVQLLTENGGSFIESYMISKF